ncbi:probable E3 ubiquitin-protein ligase HERC4 [Scylla paramamosain]|uniref:probable E3 ubiquitin-protein ligase HERC4 n=1 Tax=Scylla paramamosain TaxID=85552 RepID=UPI003083E8C4
MLLLWCDATRQGEYFPDHPVIRTFWEVFHKLSLEQKKWFLKFLTGTDRVHILGMKALKLIYNPKHSRRQLPSGRTHLHRPTQPAKIQHLLLVAHTCIAQLDLPRYTTPKRS